MNGLKTPAELARIAKIMGGMPIIGVMPNSPAAKEGLLYGDILLKIGEFEITDAVAFVEARKVHTETLPIRLLRDGEELEFELDLRERHHW